jgi:phosphatidyl-myo-inositol dimannoside synthase
MEPMNVVMLLTDAYGGYGGIAKFNRDFLEALDTCSSVKRIDVLPRLIPGPIEGSIPARVVYDQKAAAGKTAFARRLLACAARPSRIDLVICGHINLLPGAWLIARRQSARLALIIHGTECWNIYGQRTWNLKRPLFVPAQLAAAPDALISVSRHSAKLFSSWSRFPAEEAFILPNCVDLDQFVAKPRDPSLVARYGLTSSKIILTVGRLAPQHSKGFDRVITAMPRLLSRFPSLKYLIIGDGADRPRLERMAQSLGVRENVVFAGRIAESEKAAHYSLADAYVMPSRTEGFGIVLLEAAACGIPIIGSSVDGSREVLSGRDLGRVVDPDDTVQLVDSITDELMHPAPRDRKNQISQFAVPKFRQRVAGWLAKQREATLSRDPHLEQREARQNV